MELVARRQAVKGMDPAPRDPADEHGVMHRRRDAFRKAPWYDILAIARTRFALGKAPVPDVGDRRSTLEET
jgi:hypothetical protein